MATRVPPPPLMPTAFEQPKHSRGRPRASSLKDHNASQRARRIIQKKTFKRLREILPRIERGDTENRNQILERAIDRILELEAALLQTKMNESAC